MKSVLAFSLSLLVSTVTAEVQFMMVPSAETRELVESGSCASEDPDTYVPSLLALYAMECAAEIVPTEASAFDDMVTTGAGTEFAGAVSKFDGGSHRNLLAFEEQQHRHLAIDCINYCWSKKLNAPPICCLLCSWCVGSGGGGRRELAVAKKKAGIDSDVAIAKNMNKMATCIEDKFQDKCLEEEGKCFGCDGEGAFTGAIGGFVTLA